MLAAKINHLVNILNYTFSLFIFFRATIWLLKKKVTAKNILKNNF